MADRSQHNGIEFSQAELEDFQHVFPTTLAATLLGRVVEKIADSWRARLTNLSVSPDTLRQSQGALDALGSLELEVASIAALSIDWAEEEFIESELESEYQPEEPFNV